MCAKREKDDFDRAVEAEASLSPEDRERLGKDTDDYQPVTHDECIYRMATAFLKIINDKPRELWASVIDDTGITEDERSLLHSIEKAILKEAPTLTDIVKKSLAVARKLEKEHLDRVEQVSNFLSPEDLTMATMCYPVTDWNLEKYCWRLAYHLDIEDIAHVIQVISHVPSEFNWLQQAFRRVSVPSLLMSTHDRNTAWEIAASNVLEVPLPSSDQEKAQTSYLPV